MALTREMPLQGRAAAGKAQEAIAAAGFAPPTLNRNPLYHAAKRALDVLVCGTALLLLMPLFALIALCILIEDRGPILFQQKRVGKNGRVFAFYKFRSMVPNAEALLEQLAAQNEVNGPIFKMKRDPRITRVGRLLRRFSLDEAPQLWNVVRGDMSLVGPRPPLESEVHQYGPREWCRLLVTPGLTCIWQVSGRSLIGFDEWMELDLKYIRHQSFGLDLTLLVRTIPAVLTGRGAF